MNEDNRLYVEGLLSALLMTAVTNSESLVDACERLIDEVIDDGHDPAPLRLILPALKQEAQRTHDSIIAIKADFFGI